MKKLKLNKETLINLSIKVSTTIQAGGTCSTCTHLTALCDTTGNTAGCKKVP